MEIVIAVGQKICEYAVSEVGRQLGYVISLDRNVDNLKNQVKKLAEAKDGRQRAVEVARRNSEDIDIGVQHWLASVDEIVAKANDLLNDEGHARVGCSIRCFLNLRKRRFLSKKACLMAQDISEKLEVKFERIAYPPRLPVAVSAFARGYEALDSRASILNKIWKALKDADIYMVGVYGMGGVGKTTLVKELTWQAEQEGSFGAVVMATVTKNADVKRIQGEIADHLGLKFSEETEAGRAKRLRERIRMEETILVILDDIWEKLDLTDVGIPFGDDHKGCKLLLTSRDLNVLKCEVGTQKDFRLEVLSQEESWSLFEKMAGNVVNDIILRDIALKVAHRCAGLPLLIALVAKAMKNRELHVWKDALNKLTGFDHEGMGAKVYSAVELSYNCLGSDELKSFFLFCCSYREGWHTTQELLIYGWGLGLYKKVGNLTDARNRVYKLISDLRASCLLLEGEKDLVKMHDVVRDVAYHIANKIEPFFSMQEGGELQEWPEIDSLKRFHRIFLPWCHIKELPRFDCPELKLLLLDGLGGYFKVSDNFFDGLRELKVLDLGGMDWRPSPPPSLCDLTNLRTLDLCSCVLDDITIVAKLTSLKTLSLLGCEIQELPIELKQLTHLQLLDLTDCSRLKVIPRNILSSLTCLEELYMGNCFIQWGAEGSKNESSMASLGELRKLHKLRALILHIQDASVLPRNLLIFEKLENYKISIGDGWKGLTTYQNYQTSRTLKLNLSTTTNIHLDRGIQMLLNTVEDLHLAELKGVRNILCQLKREGFPQLKNLYIRNNHEIQYLIDSTVHCCQAFPNLETLVLHNLVNMEKICHGPVPIQLFLKLKVIKVIGCGKVKNLFSYPMVRDLSQLLEVEISQCQSVTQIIAQDDKEIDKIELPKLHSLTLDCLPMLADLYSKPLTVHMQSGYGVTKFEGDSPITVSLFDEKIAFPKLENLILSSINMKHIWNHPLSAHSSIGRLTNLTIDNCDGLKYLFSSSVARGLVKLKCLKIKKCKMLEEIFVSEGKIDNLHSTANILLSEQAEFPCLETLIISDMDNLKSVWKNDLPPNSFGKLSNLEITFCNQLLNIFSFYVLNRLLNLETVLVTDCATLGVVFDTQEQSTSSPCQDKLAIKLRTLTLERLPMLKQIWSNNSHGTPKFPHLSEVRVTYCENLNLVFPLSIAKVLFQLRELLVDSCGLDNIVAQNEIAEAAPALVFPQLTSLILCVLPRVRSFYPGIHTLSCPKLRTLNVFHCDKLQIFRLKGQNYQMHVPVDQQPLLSAEEAMSTIEDLTLCSKDVIMISNDQLDDSDLIYAVNDLKLQCFHDESDKFPSNFLERFTNLENLTIGCSSFKEIFPSESIEMIMKLTHLRIDVLWNLEYLCKENSTTQKILQNLETLEVSRCDGLKNIVPSSAVS